MSENSIATRALVYDGSRLPQNSGRRRFLSGLAASFGSLATGAKTTAQETGIPYFRSGRFQFTLLKPMLALPSTILFPLRSRPIELRSLIGRPILLNFWATWCEACRMEMPILDRLAQRARRSGLEIVAISEDRTEREVVERFVDKFSIHSLKIYLDPNGYVAFNDAANNRKAPFALYGMPITYAVTASGFVVGYMPGAADWLSTPAADLIEFLRQS